jgi:hypothetical protein
MAITARVYNQRQFAYVPHTDVSGECWNFIKKGTTTSAGASDGTTLIDTNGDSSGADAYNGLYWVRILSGTQMGAWCRVVDDSGAGTLTFEDLGFQGQVASAVEYEIWKSPEPVIVVDSSSSETNCVDASRNDEVNDFWKGYYVVPITGTHRGKIALVSACTQATGTFTLAASFGSALTAGDVCLLRKFVEVGDIAAELQEGYNARPQKRTNFSVGDGVIGPRSGSISFTAQVVASGTLVAAGSKAGASVLSGLLEAGGLDETVGTSCTVEAGSSTTAVEISTSQGERLTPGMMVIWNGNITWVDSITDGGGGDDIVNVTPALPLAPAAADVLYATRMYERTRDGDNRAVTIEYEIDGIRMTCTGCKGNATFQEGSVNTLSFAFSIDHWTRQKAAAPYIAGSAYTTAKAIMGTDKVCYLDSTASDMSPITSSPNAAVAPRNVQGSNGINGRAGYQTTDSAPTLTFRELLDTSGDLAADLRWSARTARKVSVAYGSHGNAAGFRIPVGRLMENPNLVDEGGLAAVPNVIEAQDAGTATLTTTTVKVPDYTFCLS